MNIHLLTKGEDITINEKNNMLENIFHYKYIVNIVSNKLVYTYTKKKYKRIRLLCNWTDKLPELWNKLFKSSVDLEFTTERNEIDYYVIINRPSDMFFIPSKTIVFRMEPDTIPNTGFYNSRWDDWYKSSDEFLFFGNLDKHMNNVEWHLSKTYEELLQSVVDKTIRKTKLFSTVVSDLYFMEGHKLRINFLKYINDKIDIDIYGIRNAFKFKNYLGRLPDHCKDDGIFPYKYTFACENCSVNNYFTEKITDAIMGECLCFYWGCKNIETFINPNAYIKLDLNDNEKSLQTIISAINNNEWEKRIDIIRNEKIKILLNYSFGIRVNNIIKDLTNP